MPDVSLRASSSPSVAVPRSSESREQSAASRGQALSRGHALRVLVANDALGYEEWGLHGGGRVVLDWSRALRERGVEVTTMVLRDPGDIRRSLNRRDVVCLDRPRYDPRTIWDFRRAIRRRRIQLLHLQGYGASTFGRIAALLSGVPSIVHIHADYRRGYRAFPPHVAFMDRVLAPFTARALVVSEALRPLAQELHGFRPEQVRVIHNAVDRERFQKVDAAGRQVARRRLSLPPTAPVVVCVARLEHVKGVDVLLKAWSVVQAQVPDAVLLQVGDGPERDGLERLARDRKYRDVRFLGYRTDVETPLRAADLAVVPSRHEGFGQVVVEAMAVGLPVVASRAGGIPEVVRPGENGILVPPHRPGHLGRAIVTGLRDDRLRRRLGRGAVRTAAEFDLSKVATRLESVYRSVLERESESKAPLTSARSRSA